MSNVSIPKIQINGMLNCKNPVTTNSESDVRTTRERTRRQQRLHLQPTKINSSSDTNNNHNDNINDNINNGNNHSRNENQATASSSSSEDSSSTDNESTPPRVTTRRAWSDYCSNSAKGRSSHSDEENGPGIYTFFNNLILLGAL